MKITQALQAEHMVFHNLFDHLERTAPKLKSLGEVRILAALLESLLEVHAVVEDRLLLEPLEPSLCQMGQHENFHEEHQEIDRSLRAAQTARRLAEGKRLLQQAVVFSRRHFDKEERIIFPLAQELLRAKTLVDLGKRWEEERKSLVAK